MDIAPRALSRWFPALGIALIAEAVFGLGPQILRGDLTRTHFADIPSFEIPELRYKAWRHRNP